MTTQPSSHMDRLMHQERFTPEELAALLDIPIDVIRNAAYQGRLRAVIAEHAIISITRDDVLAWLADRTA